MQVHLLLHTQHCRLSWYDNRHVGLHAYRSVFPLAQERQLVAGNPAFAIRHEDAASSSHSNNGSGNANSSATELFGPAANAVEVHVYTGSDAFERRGWKVRAFIIALRVHASTS